MKQGAKIDHWFKDDYKGKLSRAQARSAALRLANRRIAAHPDKRLVFSPRLDAQANWQGSLSAVGLVGGRRRRIYYSLYWMTQYHRPYSEVSIAYGLLDRA